jgi:hypothetical protein
MAEASSRNNFDASTDKRLFVGPEIPDENSFPGIDQKAMRNPEKRTLFIKNRAPPCGISKSQTSHLIEAGWKRNGLQIETKMEGKVAENRKLRTSLE